MLNQILSYFQTSSDRFWTMLAEHLRISALSLLAAVLIAVPAGFLCVRFGNAKKYVTGFFNVLRVIPSLAVLLLILPILGTGTGPAMVALVLLAIPPILMNTVAGLESVPAFLLETAAGMGMKPRQLWAKVRTPLALPLMLTGVKTAAVEIIASATLAAKIGAGGLGDLIFTGIGLFRTDLLLIGGVTVALLSLSTGLLFGLADRLFLKYKMI